MQRLILIGILLACMTGAAASARPASAASGDQVRTAIEHVHQLEQEAFIMGDCAAMASFYTDDVTFYANGRKLPSTAALVQLCERIPRPFERSADMHDRIQVLSETAAYLVRVLEFPPGADTPDRHKREVVTKIWSKVEDGWKIVHFQSSISVVTKP